MLRRNNNTLVEDSCQKRKMKARLIAVFEFLPKSQNLEVLSTSI